ncbi:MAG TPA: biotin-dependent carboxyltransferase family protein [Ilumatobacteraceae bacterium]|nr:biotin-dependent carboxyltransferase family protein [Ilumatobacteraceae bacterium]
MTPPALRIIELGRSTTLQDRGRVGRANLGVPGAGAVDRPTHDLANRLVGNDAKAASIETNGGLVIEAVRSLIVAVDGNRHTLAAGKRLRVDGDGDRMWTYVAVRGGIDVDPVLGSRSHDTLAGIGPAPIEVGVELPVGPDPGTELPTDHAPVRRRAPVVRLWPGSRSDRFVDAMGTLVGERWTVSGSVSRVGVRLEPGEFIPASDRRLASEGIVDGAIQITPAGEPIVMLANHPTTGGYPVVAVVEPDDLAIVAQSLPGTILRFVRA